MIRIINFQFLLDKKFNNQVNKKYWDGNHKKYKNGSRMYVYMNAYNIEPNHHRLLQPWN